ncbi:unnamed protein product [marine sediment metagenome]|uniref:Uncharacterized protein n=1 Tax=marine sediment metagenome TaxID=412755 RepID=X1G2X5_9ZZZZ
MSSIVWDHGICYLRENNKNLECYGKLPPIRYIPNRFIRRG